MAYGDDGNDYVLGRTLLASARLNLQHYLWVQDTGYLMHPSITVGEGFNVVDIGTGTGIWLLDLASKYPQSRFDGIDVDLSQIPPSPWLPKNVAFRQWDVTSEVPPDMVAKYDVVNIRLFMLIVQDQNPEPILQNALKLLKPGGWLQWSDYDPGTKNIVSASPDTSIDAFKAVAQFPTSLKVTKGDPRLRASWVSSLPSYFERNQLEVVAVDRKDQALSHLAYTNQVNLLTWEEARLRMDAKNAETYKAILDAYGDTDKEIQRGIAFTMQKLTVVGKKRAAQ